MHRGEIIVLTLSIVATGIAAQSSPSEAVEVRLRNLEQRAARTTELEAKVRELEGRIVEYERKDASEGLETAINALLDREPDASVRPQSASLLTIGGEFRLRMEYRTVFSYQNPPGPGQATSARRRDEDFTIQRTRVHFDARLLDRVRAFVQIQDSRTWGDVQSGAGLFASLNLTNSNRAVDLHQGYVDFEAILGTPFTLRVGRMELSLWNQRLLSPLDWSPVGRAWDGVQLSGVLGNWTLVAGYHTLLEDPQGRVPTVDSDQDTDFAWASATYTGFENHELGAAFFWLDSNPGVHEIELGTGALHAQGRFDGFDYALDLLVQFGEWRGLDVSSFAAAAELGYTFPGESKVRLGVEYTFASGDEDSTDSDFSTFYPLFPFAHKFWGYLDLVGWRNNHDLALHVSMKPSSDWWIEVAFHSFWLDEKQDFWYGANQAPTRSVGGAPPAASDSHLGFELDLSAKFWLSNDVWFWFGYSHFFAGNYIEQTGDSPDTDWLWIQLTASF